MKLVREIFSLSNKSLLLIFSILIIVDFVGCVRYASKDELLELERMKIDVYNLEKEVKELKYRQIEMVNEKARILKELKDCNNAKSSNNSSD